MKNTEWPRLTLSAGPIDVSPTTLRDQTRPILYHYDPAFIELFARTSDMLQRVFRTNYDVVIMQGEALLGFEAAAASILSPGDKALNLVSGVFGKGYERFIRLHGGRVVEVAVPYNQAVDPEDVRRALRQHPDVKMVSVVHSETSSGTLNPIADIARVAREFDVITVVDTVSGLAGEHFLPDEWGVDIAVSGPQKCIGGPPGLSLLSVSPRAWEAMERRDPPLRGSYLAILDWKDRWIEQRRFPYTPSITDIYALESALSQLLEVGLDRHVERHRLVARACRAAVRALGLTLWPASEAIAASCTTAIRFPEGITDDALRGRMRHTYGVMISGGYGELAGKLFRLSHMGWTANPLHLVAQLGALERSLADLGWTVSLGTGVGAALEALGRWDLLIGERGGAS